MLKAIDVTSPEWKRQKDENAKRRRKAASRIFNAAFEGEDFDAVLPNTPVPATEDFRMSVRSALERREWKSCEEPPSIKWERQCDPTSWHPVTASIDDMLDDIMRREGGYLVPEGIARNYGVTLDMFNVWAAKTYRPFPAQCGLVELSPEEARDILYEECFSQVGLGWLPVEIQPFMLDSVVAHGVVKAVKILQGTINLGYSSDWLEEDGVCGPVTSSEAKLAQCKNGRFLLIMLISGRAAHYSRYAVSGEVLRSWLNRVEEFLP